jgi:formylglycine-generating enzyme required for sulfatase activity
LGQENHDRKPISLFYSYSHKDEPLRRKLEDHLVPLKRIGKITEWHDRKIEAGREWEKEIDHYLSTADIILLLVSASFIASEYCWSVEIKKALERHEHGEARVIPVILRRCRWQGTPFAKLQATPKDAKPVTTWSDWDTAFDDVVSKIEAVVEELQRIPTLEFTDFAVFRDIDAPWCPEMVALPKGEFLMGSPESDEERCDDEGPQHRVTIGSRLAIGRHPLTFAEYDYFCDVTKREKPEDEGWGRGRRPVINVSWHDAQAYCKWLAKETGKPYRLPSEAEWEYAARAGTTTRYSFGNEITEKDANFRGTIGTTTEVGAYPANSWGLYDIQGNVWEWVEDIWHDSYEGAPTDGTAWTGAKGKNSSHKRLGRGGSWDDIPRALRAAGRGRGDPGCRDSDLGFRVARTLD